MELNIFEDRFLHWVFKLVHALSCFLLSMSVWSMECGVVEAWYFSIVSPSQWIRREYLMRLHRGIKCKEGMVHWKVLHPFTWFWLHMCSLKGRSIEAKVSKWDRSTSQKGPSNLWTHFLTIYNARLKVLLNKSMRRPCNRLENLKPNLNVDLRLMIALNSAEWCFWRDVRTKVIWLNLGLPLWKWSSTSDGYWTTHWLVMPLWTVSSTITKRKRHWCFWASFKHHFKSFINTKDDYAS